MNWLQSLYKVYEANKSEVGQYHATRKIGKETSPITPLLPIFHNAQNAHITVVIDGNGNFLDAKIVPPGEQTTIVPATENSEGRTTQIAAHALCDNLWYVAGNAPEFFPGKSAGKRCKSGFSDYAETLERWAASEFSVPKLNAVLTYVRSGKLLENLVEKGILTLNSDGKISEKPQNPELAKALGRNMKQHKAFIRWEVQIASENESRVWQDFSLFESWVNFRKSVSAIKGFCYVSGERDAILPQNHPAKIRDRRDGAKLISSNDSKGFTFRGKFENARQACNVSAEISQKAHNALRWLISRQGTKINGTFAVAAWCAGTVKLPSPIDDELEFGETDCADLPADAATGQKISDLLKGFSRELEDEQLEHVFIAALDSATTGRLALVYFKEFARSRYFENLEFWHTQCRWKFPAGKNGFVKYERAPAPGKIAECAFGNAVNANNKLHQATILRLLPCITERRKIPPEIVKLCVGRASNPAAFKFETQGKKRFSRDWETALSTACAVFRYNFNHQTTNSKLSMSLDKNRKSRDYLYGRLLALAEHLERSAQSEVRPTNAERFFKKFGERPNSTYLKIREALQPYDHILTKNKPGLLNDIRARVTDVMNLFDPGDFNNDSKLSGEFLLGFEHQRFANFQSHKNKQSENNENNGNAEKQN